MDKTKRIKGTKIMDAFGLPGVVDTTSAGSLEVKLVDYNLDSCFFENVLEKIDGDRAYDSDKLDILHDSSHSTRDIIFSL